MEGQNIIQPEIILFRQYRVERYASSDAISETELFSTEDYCKARLCWEKAHVSDLSDQREEVDDKWYPHTTLQLVETDDEGNEIDIRTIEENFSAEGEIAAEPLAEELLAAQNRGMEWFEQDGEFNRSFFTSEIDAVEFGRNTHDKDWTLYNLERYLEHLEGRNIRCFLSTHSAISTNKLEELAGLARGTLSKIKNGQRKLSRKQYPRIMKILPHYGYVPHVDLRLLEVIERV